MFNSTAIPSCLKDNPVLEEIVKRGSCENKSRKVELARIATDTTWVVIEEIMKHMEFMDATGETA